MKPDLEIRGLLQQCGLHWLSRGKTDSCGRVKSDSLVCDKIQFWSPRGEDVIFDIWSDGSVSDFCRCFAKYAYEFDAEDHAAGWVRYRGKNGVPNSIYELLEDADAIKNTLRSVADYMVEKMKF